MTPETILRWYRRLVAKKYDGSNTRRPGRPSTKPDVAALVVRMATENPTWGYTHIRGGLKRLGHAVARNTIKSILKDHGIEPAPERGTKTPWKMFLASHWDGLAAADFFTVEVLTLGGLVRYDVLFVMKLNTRTVEIAGITRQRDETWMTQVARNLTDTHDGYLRGVQYLIHEERPHQGLGNELIAPKTTSIGTGALTCRARLGGVLKFYDRGPRSPTSRVFAHDGGAAMVVDPHADIEHRGRIAARVVLPLPIRLLRAYGPGEPDVGSAPVLFAKERPMTTLRPYFHIVFTVPAAIAEIALQKKGVLYGILFRATAETLRTIAADPQHLGAQIGFFAVLHTWGQTLVFHPHLHCVVPGGGLSPDGTRWVSCRPTFFLSVRVLSRLFRRRFLERLHAAFAEGRLQFQGSLQARAEPQAFAAHLRSTQHVEWVVYAKAPFAGPQQVLDYVGRYTHRVAIAPRKP